MTLPKAYKEITLKNVNLIRRGKVRDLFDLGDKILMVASDRISAFDVVLPNAIPYKGMVLNSISAFWFNKFGDIMPGHLVTVAVKDFPFDMTEDEERMLEGRSSLVRKGQMIEVECVVRGFLDGSGWKSYKKSGKLFDIPLPDGLKQGDKLPEPLFTPTTKAQSGHDEYINFDQVRKKMGAETAEYLKSKSIELYNKAYSYAYERKLILADTKFEFTNIDGKICLADEIFTPDSSRFWDRETYKPGGPQPSYDKQYIRDWLETQVWDKTPPAPSLPQNVIEKSVEKYLEVYNKITGNSLS
jgi:phosphoribosylaminoimidazole-succinocarboxamide synthase